MKSKLPIFIFYVSSQEKSRDFYHSVLLCGPELDVPGMTEFKIADHALLGLMPEDSVAKLLGDNIPHPKIGRGVPRSELYIYVDDPLKYYDRAINSGAKSLSEYQRRNWGDCVAYCSDPDGHILAFAKKNS